MSDEALAAISLKLNIVISLLLRQLAGDKKFDARAKGKKGIGQVARYLADMGLEAKEISAILGAPVTSIRTLLTPRRRR